MQEYTETNTDTFVFIADKINNNKTCVTKSGHGPV